jgi:hypothetical protein
MRWLSALFADLEPMMNTPLSNPSLRYVIVVALLSMVCAFCSGCHANAHASMVAPVESGAAAPASPWDSLAPSAPLDDRSVTPMETVGASEV